MTFSNHRLFFTMTIDRLNFGNNGIFLVKAKKLIMHGPYCMAHTLLVKAMKTNDVWAMNFNL